MRPKKLLFGQKKMLCLLWNITLQEQHLCISPFSLQGLTVRLEEGRIKVSRILVDSIIDRQGLVQCGDIILQVTQLL